MKKHLIRALVSFMLCALLLSLVVLYPDSTTVSMIAYAGCMIVIVAYGWITAK